MGLKHASKEKNVPWYFFIFVHKNVYRIRFQKIKIGPLKGFEKSQQLNDGTDLMKNGTI